MQSVSATLLQYTPISIRLKTTSGHLQDLLAIFERYFPSFVIVIFGLCRLCSIFCGLHSRTFFELNLQNVRRVRGILWVLGHQVQVKRRMTLEGLGETRIHWKSLSIFLSLYSQWWITTTFRDLIKKEKVRQTGSALCEMMTDNSRDGRRVERRGWCVKRGETWKSHQEWRQKRSSSRKKKINVPFFSSVWFHFPCVALHRRGEQGKWEGEQE